MTFRRFPATTLQLIKAEKTRWFDVFSDTNDLLLCAEKLKEIREKRKNNR